MSDNRVVFLNPRTCGIYKNGAPRFKTNPVTGRRTDEIDNELIDAVKTYLSGDSSIGDANIALSEVFDRKILVPTYYDSRYEEGLSALLQELGANGVTLGSLLDAGLVTVRGGHGSPSNDQRTGHIPYVKVSDIRGLRINVYPTNLVTETVARRYWRADTSGLREWDLITPNRASSNIGEFAILLPGEEQVVLTKEVFVFRVPQHDTWDASYLLWALSLKAVRDQWRRVALMQTNREDCGTRYREIVVPEPPSREWAQERSAAFRSYFTSLAKAKASFVHSVTSDGVRYIASVLSALQDDAEDRGAGEHQ